MRRGLSGHGSVRVAAARGHVWSALLDPAVLRSLIPGADEVERVDGSRYRARLSFGVGRVRGRYDVRLRLFQAVPPHRLDLAGECTGLLGGGGATAHVELADVGPAETSVSWSYDGVVTGPVALAGAALLRATSTLFVHRFFAAVARHLAAVPGEARTPTKSFGTPGRERVPPESASSAS